MRLIDADALMEKLEAWKKEAERINANINYTFASAIMAQVNAEPTIEERKWIPCSERLPEEKREVLVSTKDGYLNIAFLETLSTGDFEWTDVIEYFQIPNVTAWMPLPEPYAERRTDE